MDKLTFKPGFTYYAKHVPTSETWVVLGIDQKRNRVCAAGWPATIAKLSDMIDFEEVGEIKDDELNYRNKEFGSNWD